MSDDVLNCCGRIMILRCECEWVLWPAHEHDFFLFVSYRQKKINKPVNHIVGWWDCWIIYLQYMKRSYWSIHLKKETIPLEWCTKEWNSVLKHGVVKQCGQSPHIPRIMFRKDKSRKVHFFTLAVAFLSFSFLPPQHSLVHASLNIEQMIR